MPLHISEIGVHIAVGGAGPSTPAEPQPTGGSGLTPAQHDEIVAACVQQVLKNLKQMQDR